MKLPFVAAIAAFFRNHLLLLAGLLALILAAVGGYFGWQHYQYRQTADFAFLRFKEALQPANLEELVGRVDFNAVTLPLARAVSRHYPFLKQGPQQEQHLNDMIQTALFKQTRLKEEAPKEQPDAVTRLKTPLYALPPDFLTQLAASLALQESDGASALLTAVVRHQLLDKAFPVQLRMEHAPSGWRVRGLANAEELVAQFRAAQLERMNGQRQLLVDKNTRTKKRMEQTLPIRACTASAGLLSDGKTLLLVVSVEAKNEGQAAVNNINLSVTVCGADGRELLHRYLNAVVPTMPQQPLNHSWTIEMDGASPEAQAILAAAPLSCKTAWQTMGLASGEVLHITDVPEPEEEFR
ncbi:MAG: translation initiation factor IF-2 [Desulfovibrio desulfuricans]|jgi:hypothetical protein|nr:translation initiation factor IF-2 [Desulfovibrio desulfuricans]